MREAANCLIGTHDFASFTSNPGYARKSTVRTIYSLTFSRSGSRITLRAHGNGFLFRMVRNLMGALVKIGHGRLAPRDIKKILQARSRSAAPSTAPAHGLYLAKVYYK